MRILHIHTAFDTGGIESFVVALANEQACLGEEVCVCSIFTPSGEAVCWNKLTNQVQKYVIGKRSGGFSIKEPVAIFRLIRQLHPNVVHMHGFIAYYLLSVFMLHRSIRFVYTVHNDAAKEGNHWDHYFSGIKRWLFRQRWVAAVTISNESDKSFADFYGLCDRTLIYNGIYLPPFPIGSREDLLFLNPGRITEQKNQVMLCRVFHRLVQEKYPVHLLIAGEKQDETTFRQMQPYFCPQIEYIGCRSDIPQLMARAGAMCLPSLWEGMPITLLEALASGCLPICTPVGGIKDVLEDGVNGLMTSQVNEEEYYQKILQYLRLSQEEHLSMRKNARQTAEVYSIEHTAKQYLTLYSSKR